MLTLVYHMGMSAIVKSFLIIIFSKITLWYYRGKTKLEWWDKDMKFSDLELQKMLKFIRMAKDQSRELYEAMIDIENYGEVDHDGMPVMNSLELKKDIEDMDRLIEKIALYLSLDE